MGLLTAACSQLEQLKFDVQLPEQRVKVEMLRKGVFWLPTVETSTNDIAPDQLGFTSLGNEYPIGKPCVSRQQRQELQQAVARQVGACLHVAHLLQLRPLIDALQRFIFWAAGRSEGLLFGVLELVFTDAVFDTVLGSGTVSKQAYVNSVLTLPFDATNDSFWDSGLLRRCGPLTVGDDECVCRDATLLRDFAQCAEGTIVEAKLLLEQGYHNQGPCVVLTHKNAYDEYRGTNQDEFTVRLPAQLLLGHHHVGDRGGWNKIMSSNMR